MREMREMINENGERRTDLHHGMPREVEQERAGELDAVPHESPVSAHHPVAPLDARGRVPLGEQHVPHAIHHGDPANNWWSF